MAEIMLQTANGVLVLRQPDPPENRECSFCSTVTAQAAELESEARATDGAPARRFEGNICGNCLSAGLAIAAGSIYVSRDGDVDDLRLDGHIWRDDRAVCARCGRSRVAIEQSGETCSGRPI